MLKCPRRPPGRPPLLRRSTWSRGGRRETWWPGRPRGPGSGRVPRLWVWPARSKSRDFGEVLDGRDPLIGGGAAQPAGERSVAGYDLTFCAPKSVSLLHLLAPGEMADRGGAGSRRGGGRGHRLSRAGGAPAFVAAGHGETALRRPIGVVAGSFLHRTSRALDPHLHTHLVVANVTQGVDGGLVVGGRAEDLRPCPGGPGASITARLRLELSRPARGHLGRAAVRAWATWSASMPRCAGSFPSVPSGIEEHLAGRGGTPGSALVAPCLPRHPTRKDRPCTVEAGGRVEAAGSGLRVRPRRPDPGGRSTTRPSRSAPSTAGGSRTTWTSWPSTAGHWPAGTWWRWSPPPPRPESGPRSAEQVAARLIEEAGPPVVRRPGRESTAHPGREREGVIARWDALALLRAVEHWPGEMAAGAALSQVPTSDGLVPAVVGRPTPRWEHDRSMVLGPAPGRRWPGLLPPWISAAESSCRSRRPVHRSMPRVTDLPEVQPICRSDGGRSPIHGGAAVELDPAQTPPRLARRSRGPAGSTPAGCAHRRPARGRRTRGR